MPRLHCVRPFLADRKEVIPMMSTTLDIVEHHTEADLRREFAQAVEQYRRYHKCMAWEIGDRAIALQECKKAVLHAEAAELRARAGNCTDDQEGNVARRDLLTKADRLEKDDALSGYTRQLCEANHIDEGYVRNCVMLARFYPVSLRHDTLLVEHHVVAMQAARKKLGGGTSSGGTTESKGVGIAAGWLSKAEQEGMKASELRRQANASLATHTPPAGPPEADPYTELTAFDEWSISHRATLATLTQSQCEHLWSLSAGVREWVEALRLRIE